jgi:hypothetical protein
MKDPLLHGRVDEFNDKVDKENKSGRLKCYSSFLREVGR